MPSVNKQTCPTCHQPVNYLEVSMYRGLMVSLFKVWRYLEDNDVTELTMKQIRDLIGYIEYGRFNNLKRFEPDLVWGKRGQYIFDRQGLRDIFTGQRKICTMYLNDPINGRYHERVEFKFASEISSIKDFLDEQGDYIAKYQGKVELEQGALL